MTFFNLLIAHRYILIIAFGNEFILIPLIIDPASNVSNVNKYNNHQRFLYVIQKIKSDLCLISDTLKIIQEQGFKSVKVLITGAAGFVASHIIEYINRYNNEIEIIGIDNLSYGYKERLEGLSLEFIQGDVEDIEKYNIRDVSAIIHTAAIAPLPHNEINPTESYKQNVVNTIRVAEFASKIGCKKIIFLSTSAIYENDIKFPSKEREHLNTTLVYPTTKMCAEHALNAYSNSYSLSTYALRLFNLYGPRQDYFREQPPLIGYLLRSIFNNEIAELYSNGEQSRDYIYIDDLAKVIINLLNKQDNKKGLKVLNVGSGLTTSVNEIIDILSKISGNEIRINRNSSEKFWDNYSSLFDRDLPLNKDYINKEVNKYSKSDNTILHELTGINCNTSMEEGLKKCYDFAKKYFNK